jgi:hypothetical protein
VTICIQSAIMWHDSNFKFINFKYLYASWPVTICNIFQTFSMHPDQWLYTSNRSSCGMIQILNLWILKKFKNIFTMVLNRAKNIRSLMVKIVFESNISLRNYREKIEEIKVDACMSAYVGLCQVTGLLAERFLYGNELVLIHSNTGFYGSSRQKRFCAVRHRILCILLVRSLGPHLHVSSQMHACQLAGGVADWGF